MVGTAQEPGEKLCGYLRLETRFQDRRKVMTWGSRSAKAPRKDTQLLVCAGLYLALGLRKPR